MKKQLTIKEKWKMENWKDFPVCRNTFIQNWILVRDFCRHNQIYVDITF